MSCFQRPGGFHLAPLGRRSCEARANMPEAPAQPARHRRLPDRDARPRRGRQRCCPTSARRWSGGSYCPLDGHVNSLRLFRALHTAHQRARRRPTCRAIASSDITQRGRRVPADDGEGRDARRQGRARRRQRQHAAGADGRPRGADAARARPDRRDRARCGRSCTIRSSPLRQTDEGTVMIGDSQGGEHRPTRPDDRRQRRPRPSARCACSRCSPTLNVVRTWSAHPRHDAGRLPDLRPVRDASRRLRRCAAIPA